jgi:hypothetical protein
MRVLHAKTGKLILWRVLFLANLWGIVDIVKNKWKEISAIIIDDGEETEIRAIPVVLYVKDTATGKYVPLEVTDGKIQVSTT